MTMIIIIFNNEDNDEDNIYHGQWLTPSQLVAHKIIFVHLDIWISVMIISTQITERQGTAMYYHPAHMMINSLHCMVDGSGAQFACTVLPVTSSPLHFGDEDIAKNMKTTICLVLSIQMTFLFSKCLFFSPKVQLFLCSCSIDSAHPSLGNKNDHH